MKTAIGSLALLIGLIGCTLAGDRTQNTASSSPKAHVTDATSQSSNSAMALAETERLYAFFEDVYESELMQSPIALTYQGRRERYGEWDDVSSQARDATYAARQMAYKRMRSEFELETLTPDGQLSWLLFEYATDQERRLHAFRNHSYVFNQMFGQQSAVPAFLINQHRVLSVPDAEAYISRIEGVRAYLGQHLANAQERALIGIRPPRFVYDYVISDVHNVVTGAPFDKGPNDSPIFADFKSKISALDITEAEKADLIARGQNALITSVLPAYEELAAWLIADKTRASDDDGAWRLPAGDSYYSAQLRWHTTTDLSAAEIHDIGLAEVARIHDEMRTIMKTVDFQGNLTSFFEFMRVDDQFYFENTDAGREAYLTQATSLIDTMKDQIPDVFDTLPKADLVVKRVEPFREKSAGKAFYQRPAPDGSRPGTYYANLYDMDNMPSYQMEALAYHEGIPGHHMQLAIAQELQSIPKFRKFGSHTAYIEGWGLYSEYLPKEMGFYKDPYSDFGRLAMELWRAARLVVDTGLHDKRWTREQATQYLIDNTPNQENDCRKAIDRYIVMPGQATAYKIGMLEILRLREASKAALADKFELSAFHDVVLANGSVPLNILEQLVDDWTEEQSK